jgi:hypothetical protein
MAMPQANDIATVIAIRVARTVPSSLQRFSAGRKLFRWLRVPRIWDQCGKGRFVADKKL